MKHTLYTYRSFRQSKSDIYHVFEYRIEDAVSDTFEQALNRVMIQYGIDIKDIVITKDDKGYRKAQSSNVHILDNVYLKFKLYESRYKNEVQ